MAFWSNQLAGEPKRNYRWVLNFTSQVSPDINALTYALKKVDKPKAKIAETTHKYLNHFFYYPGRLEWEAINMTFASMSEPDTAALVDFIKNVAGYIVPNDANERSTVGKRKFNTALGNNLILTQIDANGFAIERWELSNPFFTTINFGTMDYGNEDITEISTTVRYDYAKLTSVNNPSNLG